MTPRQQQAAVLAREIAALGAWCINPMPLDDAANLRFQVLDTDADRIVRMLCEAGWLPQRMQVHYRVTPQGLVPASLYEINIPRERQVVPDARPAVRGEIEERKKTDGEVEKIMKHLGRA